MCAWGSWEKEEEEVEEEGSWAREDCSTPWLVLLRVSL
jgi:hypothetical protein